MKLLVYHQIDLSLINLGFELRTVGKKRKEIREIILKVFESLGVGIPTSKKRWQLISTVVFKEHPVSKHILRFWNAAGEQERDEFCICASLLAFPILNQVLDTVVQLNGIRDSVSQTEIRNRISKIHGARSSVKQSVQKCLQSLNKWNVIHSPKPGYYIPRNPIICTSIVGSVAIASQLQHSLSDGIRIENVASKSPLSIWDFSSFTPDKFHCIQLRVGAQGREFVVVE